MKHVPSLSKPLSKPAFEMMIFPFRVRVGFEDFFIKPSQESLIIEPRKDDPEIFKKISKISEEIYSQLQHTPITGIGHNFTFTLGTEEVFAPSHTPLDESVKNHLPGDLSATLQPDIASQLRYSLKFTDKGYTLNLMFDNAEDGTRKLNFNFHYNLENKPPEEVIQVLASFSESYTIAEKVKDAMIKEG